MTPTDTLPIPKKRVVLANVSRVLAAIVSSVVDRQPDMAVVGTVQLGDADAIDALRPDAVILAPSRLDPDDSARDALRREHPDLTLLELRVRDDRAVLWCPSVGPALVTELSAAAIVGAVRDAPPAAKGGDR